MESGETMYSMLERASRWIVNQTKARWHWVKGKDYSMHVLIAKGRRPDRPSLILVHGISGSSLEFVPLIGFLRNDVSSLFLPDLPGHGFSPPPLNGMSPSGMLEGFLKGMKHLIAEQGNRPVIIFGNSLGGAATLQFASRYPKLVKGVILSSPGGGMLRESEFKSFLKEFDIQTRGDALNFLKRLYAAPPWYTPLITGYIRWRFNRPNLKQFLAKISVLDLLAPSIFRSLAVPVHILWGKKDRVQGPEQLRFFVENAPQHFELIEPSDFGHCPHLEAPKQLARYIHSFINQL